MLDDNDLHDDDDDGDNDHDHPVAVHDGVEPVGYGEHCAVGKLLPVNDQNYYNDNDQNYFDDNDQIYYDDNDQNDYNDDDHDDNYVWTMRIFSWSRPETPSYDCDDYGADDDAYDDADDDTD